MLLPTLTWSAYRLDEVRADGAVFSFLALGFLGFTLLRHRRLQPLPGGFLLLAALLCGFIPLFRVASEGTGWAPTLGGLADRAPLLAGIALVAAVATWKQLSARALLLPLLAAGAIAAVLGWCQALGWNPPGYDSDLAIKPTYPFAGPTHALEFQLPLLLLGLAFLPRNPRAQKLSWIALAPMALQVGYLSSNAGRLALLAGLSVLFLRDQSRRIPALTALILVVCGELSRALLGGGGEAPDSDVIPRGFTVRKELYLTGAGHFFTHPLGIGIGQFESDYPEWRSEAEATLTSNNWADTSHRIPKTPHEDYLLAGLELGWIGFLLLGLAARQTYLARRAGAQELQEAEDSGTTTAFWIGLGTLALFRSPISDNAASLGLAALVLGSELRAFRPTHLKAAAFGPVLPALLGLIAVTPAWAQWRGEAHAAAAIQDQENLEQHLTDAVNVRPWDNRSLVLLGSFNLASTNPRWDVARDCFDLALVHHPTDLAALTAYIKVEMYAPDGDENLMLRLLARGEQFAPFHPSVIDARVQWLQGYQKAFQDEAVRRVQNGIPNAGPWWSASHLAQAYIAAVQRDPEAMRKSLYLAAANAPGGTKGLIQRTAENEEATPDTIAQLTSRVFPEWPRVTY